MSVYVYTKEKPQYVKLLAGTGTVVKGRRDPIFQFVKNRKKEQLIIAGVLSLIGLVLLASQFIPLGFSYLQASSIEDGLGEIKSPVPESYTAEERDGEIAYYDIQKSYFGNLVQSLGGSTLLATNGNYGSTQGPLIINESYSGKMRLSISSIGIQDLSITPNVDSYDEDIYNRALKGGSAHFRGTPLPGDNSYGNFVIYGHSALPSFFNSNPNYDETEFTKLHKIRVGDKITVTKDGKVYTYQVIKNQIVDPGDFSIMEGNQSESTMTLITCFPAGDPSGRWVTLAREIW